MVWILWLPYGASFGSRVGYLIAFVIFMLALDALFTYALALDGPTSTLDRLLADLRTADRSAGVSSLRHAAGGARRRCAPRGSAQALGHGSSYGFGCCHQAVAGTAHRCIHVLPIRPATGVAFVVVGFGLALISLIFGGWSRLISPLTWQSDRGLQIESIWATPLMLARALRPDQWIVDISQYQAYEIFGPGVDAWVMISSIATLLGLALIILLTPCLPP